MKTKLILLGLIVVMAGGCFAPAYVPIADKIDINEHGSYIVVKRLKASKIDGELIAIDSQQMVVLNNLSKRCVLIPVSEVKRFTLRYAEGKHYIWTIPLYTVACFAHGLYSIYTIPINLIVTISVTASGENAFTYSDKNMTYEEMKMFARFPQGLPPDISLANIK